MMSSLIYIYVCVCVCVCVCTSVKRGSFQNENLQINGSVKVVTAQLFHVGHL